MGELANICGGTFEVWVVGCLVRMSIVRVSFVALAGSQQPAARTQQPSSLPNNIA